MGLVALLITILIGAMMWFYFPALSPTGQQQRIDVGTQSIQKAQNAANMMNARNKQTYDELNAQ